MLLLLGCLMISNGFSCTPLNAFLRDRGRHVISSWNGRAILIADDVEQRQDKLQQVSSMAHFSATTLLQETHGDRLSMDAAFIALAGTHYLVDSHGNSCWSEGRNAMSHGGVGNLTRAPSSERTWTSCSPKLCRAESLPPLSLVPFVKTQNPKKQENWVLCRGLSLFQSLLGKLSWASFIW